MTNNIIYIGILYVLSVRVTVLALLAARSQNQGYNTLIPSPPATPYCRNT